MKFRYKILARIQKACHLVRTAIRWVYTSREERLYSRAPISEAPSGPLELIPYESVPERDLESLDSYLRVQAMKCLIQEGQLGFVVMRDGVPVHRSFVLQGPRTIQIGGGPFFLSRHEALIHYCKTDPRHRGRGIYPTVLRSLMAELDAQRVYISCDARNMSSIRGIKKAGFETVGRRRHRTLFGVRRVAEA